MVDPADLTQEGRLPFHREGKPRRQRPDEI